MDDLKGTNQQGEFRWYRSTFGKMLVLAPLLAVLTVAFCAWHLGVKRSKCDKAAASDVKRLAAAVERLGRECSDLNWIDCCKDFSEEHIRYVLGPYYGWRGTTGRCAVLLALKGRELQSCAKLGTFPGKDKTERLIHRVTLDGFQELPPAVGRCEGRQYGYKPDVVYLSSMVDSREGKRFFREPQDHIPK